MSPFSVTACSTKPTDSIARKPAAAAAVNGICWLDQAENGDIDSFILHQNRAHSQVLQIGHYHFVMENYAPVCIHYNHLDFICFFSLTCKHNKSEEAKRYFACKMLKYECSMQFNKFSLNKCWLC